MVVKSIKNAKKVAKIMRSGGWAVLVAVIAMALYLFVLEIAEKAITNMKVDLIVKIDENGYLSTNYKGDKEDVYILWETDGGSIVPVEEEEKESLILLMEEENESLRSSIKDLTTQAEAYRKMYGVGEGNLWSEQSNETETQGE